ARPDGCRAGHEAAAEARLGIGNGCMGHALLVLAAIGGQRVLHAIERLAHGGDIAVAENGKDATKYRHSLALDDGLLHGQVPGDGLRHGQSDRILAHSASVPAGSSCCDPSTRSQISTSAPNRRAMSSTASS